MPSRLYTTLLLSLLLVVVVAPSTASAQGNKDTINYSSTCVNATIVFGSPLLDTFFKPDYTRWHFGDPGSGYNDSSGGKSPAHIYSTPGQYYVSLDVWYSGSDT